MDLAICTRCQSSNPVFTKYCLTCGLAITADMKKKINIVASAATVAVAAKTAPVVTAAANISPTTAAAVPVALPSQTEAPATPQTAQTVKEKEKEGATGWLRGLRFLTRS